MGVFLARNVIGDGGERGDGVGGLAGGQARVDGGVGHGGGGDELAVVRENANGEMRDVVAHEFN